MSDGGGTRAGNGGVLSTGRGSSGGRSLAALAILNSEGGGLSDGVSRGAVGDGGRGGAGNSGVLGGLHSGGVGVGSDRTGKSESEHY